MDEAVRLLNNRTEDEVELDLLVNQPLVAKIPGLKTLAVMGSQVSSLVNTDVRVIVYADVCVCL